MTSALTTLGCDSCGEPSTSARHAFLPWRDERTTPQRHAFSPPHCRACGRPVSQLNVRRLCGGLRPCSGGEEVAL